jgi:hypothetical protein
MPVTPLYRELVLAALALSIAAVAPPAEARTYTPEEVTKSMVDAWWHLTYACHGNDDGRPDHAGGDPSACQLREHLARYIEERGWCFSEAWTPCR